MQWDKKNSWHAALWGSDGKLYIYETGDMGVPQDCYWVRLGWLERTWKRRCGARVTTGWWINVWFIPYMLLYTGKTPFKVMTTASIQLNLWVYISHGQPELGASSSWVNVHTFTPSWLEDKCYISEEPTFGQKPHPSIKEKQSTTDHDLFPFFLAPGYQPWSFS